MARRRARRKKDEGWREHVIIVKKTHPLARSKEEAARVAERHAKVTADTAVSSDGTYRVALRPKSCFRDFRSQPRGPFVTVTWGQLRVDMKGKPECR